MASGRLATDRCRRPFLLQETKDAPITLNLNGTRRAKNATECDFLLTEDDEDVRYEVKSAVLTWNRSIGRWEIHFSNVKLSQHDRIVLVVIDVDQLHVFLRSENTCAGNSTAGVTTESNGQYIVVCASTTRPNFSDAMENVLERMRDEQGTLLGNIRFDDPAFEDIFSMRTNGDVVYAGTPMAKVCRNISGNICEIVIRQVHARYLPSSVEVVDAVVGTRCDGRNRCKNTTSYDFGARTGSDTKRVEVKSSKLYFDGKKRCNCWCASFVHVKFHKFDELLFGLITPDALCCPWRERTASR